MVFVTPDDGDRALEVLEQAGILHALIGGMAANLYRSEFRATKDFDFLVETFEGLHEALETAGFEVELGAHGTQDEWLIRATVDGIGCDFSLAEIDIQERTIINAQSNAGIATVEDLIVLKLIANRPQDLDDLASIIKGGRSIDLEYVRAWSTKLDDDFGTASRFQRFRETYISAHGGVGGG